LTKQTSDDLIRARGRESTTPTKGIAPMAYVRRRISALDRVRREAEMIDADMTPGFAKAPEVR